MTTKEGLVCIDDDFTLDVVEDDNDEDEDFPVNVFKSERGADNIEASEESMEVEDVKDLTVIELTEVKIEVSESEDDQAELEESERSQVELEESENGQAELEESEKNRAELEDEVEESEENQAQLEESEETPDDVQTPPPSFAREYFHPDYPDVIRIKISQDGDVINTSYLCRLCPFSTTDCHGAEHHGQCHVNVKFKCKTTGCQYSTFFQDDFEEHEKTCLASPRGSAKKLREYPGAKAPEAGAKPGNNWPNKTRLACPYCNKRSDDVQSHLLHVRACKSKPVTDPKNSQKGNKPLNLNYNYKCPMCMKTFYFVDRKCLIPHAKTHYMHCKKITSRTARNVAGETGENATAFTVRNVGQIGENVASTARNVAQIGENTTLAARNVGQIGDGSCREVTDVKSSGPTVNRSGRNVVILNHTLKPLGKHIFPTTTTPAKGPRMRVPPLTKITPKQIIKTPPQSSRIIQLLNTQTDRTTLPQFHITNLLTPVEKGKLDDQLYEPDLPQKDNKRFWFLVISAVQNSAWFKRKTRSKSIPSKYRLYYKNRCITVVSQKINMPEPKPKPKTENVIVIEVRDSDSSNDSCTTGDSQIPATSAKTAVESLDSNDQSTSLVLSSDGVKKIVKVVPILAKFYAQNGQGFVNEDVATNIAVDPLAGSEQVVVSESNNIDVPVRVYKRIDKAKNVVNDSPESEQELTDKEVNADMDDEMLIGDQCESDVTVDTSQQTLEGCNYSVKSPCDGTLTEADSRNQLNV